MYRKGDTVVKVETCLPGRTPQISTAALITKLSLRPLSQNLSSADKPIIENFTLTCLFLTRTRLIGQSQEDNIWT